MRDGGGGWLVNGCVIPPRQQQPKIRVLGSHVALPNWIKADSIVVRGGEFFIRAELLPLLL